MSGSYVYVDVANITHSAQRLNIAFDVTKLIHYLKDVYRTSYVMCFTGFFKNKQNEYDTLINAGAEMVYKKIYNEAKYTKANCDVEIAHRITRDILTRYPGQIIVVSGDGDFACLYDFARAQGVKVKVLAFDSRSCARIIKQRAFTRVSFLMENVERFKNEKPPANT